MKSRIIFISITILTVCTIAIATSISKVKALYLEQSFYDSMSWIYSYQAPYTNSYNCLGWATGSMTFEWPSYWNTGATQSQVSSYLLLKGYTKSNLSPNTATRIIAYGPSYDYITHFAKATSGTVTAKWGGLERFTHFQNYDPYYANSDYGLARANFY